MPLPVMDEIISHDRIASLSLALNEDGSDDLLPALAELAEQYDRPLGIKKLSVCTGVATEQSATGREALASPATSPPPPFRKVLRNLIIKSLTMNTLMFRNKHTMDEEEMRLLHWECSVMAPMMNTHPLKNLSVRGATSMAAYTLFGARLSYLTCLELQNIDDCTWLIEAIICGVRRVNLKILRVTGLPEPTRDRSQRALMNLLRAFQGLEQVELDGVDIDDFTDAIIHHGATLRTVSLVNHRDGYDRGVMKRRAASYSKLAKGCPHLRQLRVNEIPNLIGIADAFVGNALQTFNRLETLILMPSPLSSPSTLRPISDMQIYSVARDVMSEKLRTLEVIGAYIPTQCNPFDIFRGWSRAEIVHPDRKYHWKIDCRKHELSPINMMSQIDQERDLFILRLNEKLAKGLGLGEYDALDGVALQAAAVSRYDEAIHRLLQVAFSLPEELILYQILQQRCNNLGWSVYSLGYDTRL